MSGVWYNVRRNVHEALEHMDARHRYVAQVVQLQLDLPLLTIEEFVAGDEQLRTLSDFFAADSILTRLFFFRASAVAQPQSGSTSLVATPPSAAELVMTTQPPSQKVGRGVYFLRVVEGSRAVTTAETDLSFGAIWEGADPLGYLQVSCTATESAVRSVTLSVCRRWQSRSSTFRSSRMPRRAGTRQCG